MLATSLMLVVPGLAITFFIPCAFNKAIVINVFFRRYNEYS